MARPRKEPSTAQLPDALAAHRKVSIQDAAALCDLHVDTFRRHFPHLIKKIGPRLDRVDLRDVLAIGQVKR
jgi:hypothetical protein